MLLAMRKVHKKPIKRENVSKKKRDTMLVNGQLF